MCALLDDARLKGPYIFTIHSSFSIYVIVDNVIMNAGCDIPFVFVLYASLHHIFDLKYAKYASDLCHVMECLLEMKTSIPPVINSLITEVTS